MTRSWGALGSFAVSVLAFASACGGDPACPSADGLRTQLAAGGRVDVPSACVLSGSFTVPAGATLHGGTFALDAGDAITLAPASTGTATTLSGARITGGSASASVLASGSGSVAITDVVLDLERGIGIGISGASATLTNVTATGNVDPAHVLDLPGDPPLATYPGYGIAAVDGADVRILGSEVSAMAHAGVVCESASVDLETTSLDGNRSFGVLAFDCAMRATDVEVAHTLSVPTQPCIAVALFEGAHLDEGTRLSLHDDQGYGVFARGGSVTMVDPTVAQLALAGVWVEDADLLSLGGGTFADGAGAGITAIGVATVDVHGTSVARTRSAMLPTNGGLGSVSLGDALHLVQRAGHASTITLADLVLTENERVGVVVDGGGDPLALTIATTRVETSGTELGALAQHVTSLPAGWDGGVTRVGSAATLDASAAPVVISDGAGDMGILMPPTILF